jgi:hypothetical protein
MTNPSCTRTRVVKFSDIPSNVSPSLGSFIYILVNAQTLHENRDGVCASSSNERPFPAAIPRTAIDLEALEEARMCPDK